MPMNKRSMVPGKVPTVSDLKIGELALNFPDKKIYSKDADNEVVEIASVYDESDVNITGGNIDPQNVELKVDDAYGWVTLSETPTVGVLNVPTMESFRGGIYALTFDAGIDSDIFINIQLNNDYEHGTPIFIFVNWAPGTSETGSVIWEFEYTIAKGFGQATGSVFGQTTTFDESTSISVASIYKLHTTSNSTGITSALLEPGSIISCKIRRKGTSDTNSGKVFAFKAGVHYQKARLSTLNRTPDFYTSGV